MGACQGLPSLPLCTRLVRKANISFNYMSSSDSMDRDDSGSGWDGLGHDVQLSILSVLKQRKDKASLQAVIDLARPAAAGQLPHLGDRDP